MINIANCKPQTVESQNQAINFRYIHNWGLDHLLRFVCFQFVFKHHHCHPIILSITPPPHTSAASPAAMQAESSDVHVAGTPCVDFSLRGNQMQELGPAFLVFLCWCAHRREQQEAVIVQENVTAFPVQLLIDLLGDIYDIQSACINPASLGFPSQRSRQWVVMRHRTKTCGFSLSLDVFSKLFQAPLLFGAFHDLRNTMPGWSVYFQNTVESAFYMLQELHWACSRRESSFDANTAMPTLDQFNDAVLKNSFETISAWFYNALTLAEQEQIVEYRAILPNMAYSLNQKADFSATASTWETLHTVIKNAGIIWNLALFHLGANGEKW